MPQRPKQAKPQNQPKAKQLPGPSHALRSPVVRPGPLSEVRIRNREIATATWVDQVTAANGTQLNKAITPAIGNWLGAIAENFALYKFNSLSFHYPAGVSVANNGQTGIAFVAGDSVTTVSSLASLSGIQDAVVGPVWQELLLDIPPAHLHRLPWYDTETTNTFNSNVGSVCGSCTLPAATTPTPLLWVEYDVTLREPKNQAV